MYTSPTLTQEEFGKIDHARYSLRLLEQDIDGVLNEHLVERLKSAITALDEALRSAYDAEENVVDTRCDHYSEVATLWGIADTVWSIYTVEDMLDLHPWGPVDRIVYRDHGGSEPVSASVQGTTWAALWRAADECVRASGDSHHVFIESLEIDKSDPKTLVLGTGS